MAKWVEYNGEHEGGLYDYCPHACSDCGSIALFEVIYEEDWDEDIEGYPTYLGLRIGDIKEHITKYCPNCGAKMNYKEAMHDIYGCKSCSHFTNESRTYCYTKECYECSMFPWIAEGLGEDKWSLKDDSN